MACHARRTTHQILETLLPTRCLGCGIYLPTGRRAFPLCPTCSAQVFPSWEAADEPAAIGKPDVHAHAVFFYTGLIPDLVLRLKYGRDFAAARPLGRLMAAVALRTRLWPCDCVVPVPSARSRHKARGYNPAGLLADTVARTLGCPVEHHALVRTDDGGSQGRLDPDARRRRVAQAFTAGAQPPAGQRVLLVDDVYTTGATLTACALTLKRHDARVVGAVTFARAVPPDF